MAEYKVLLTLTIKAEVLIEAADEGDAEMDAEDMDPSEILENGTLLHEIIDVESVEETG